MATAHRKPDLQEPDLQNPHVRNEGLYDSDFHAWTQAQAALIRAGRVGELDLPNILEEIESLGRGERRELVNRLTVLIAHLLKWQVQSQFRSRSWLRTIAEQQKRIAEHLNENPSLKATLGEAVRSAFDRAVYAAQQETGLDRALFPASLPFSFDQLVDPDFLPGDL